MSLVFTGGTFDSVGASRTDTAWYYETGVRVDPEEMLGAIPELADLAAVTAVPAPRLSSSGVTDAQWIALVSVVRRLVESEAVDALVVSHGTNTLEETAFLLHLTVATDKPVVVVGAMRPPSALGSEAPMNLLRAVQVAAAPASRGHGVLVVMNDAILAARDVTKTATFRLDALRAPDLGPLGYADADNRVVFYHRHLRAPLESSPFELDGLGRLPRVDLVTSHVGADAALIDAAVAAGAEGIVSAGTGAGRPTPLEEGALEAASASGVIVCQASRVGSGRVVLSPRARRPGWVSADNLQPWKARVLLALALTVTRDAGRIQEMLDFF